MAGESGVSESSISVSAGGEGWDRSEESLVDSGSVSEVFVGVNGGSAVAAERGVGCAYICAVPMVLLVLLVLLMTV